MDLKKKAQDAKTKISEHRYEILTAVSTGMTIAVSVALIRTKGKLDRSYLDNVKYLSRDLSVGMERLFISDETTDQILKGSKDVWFDVYGNRFDVILHDPEV